MAAKRRRTRIEWVGGLVELPREVTGEGEPFRPESLLWISADGAVLGHAVGRPGELLGEAAESLRSTIERPMVGEPHAPERVRVASPELAEALRSAHPGIEIVCAATPEIDRVVALMGEDLSDAAELTYLSREVGVDAVAALCRAAAGLFRAKPWEVLQRDQSLLSVTIEELGVREGALSVLGQSGESRGFVLFASLDDFDAYLDVLDAIDEDEESTGPNFFSLTFERRLDLPLAVRDEFNQHGWETASAEAYPSLVPADQAHPLRPPNAKEVATAEAIALALTALLAEKEALLAAGERDETVERTLAVTTHRGTLEVTFRVPFEESSRFRPPYDVIAHLTELGRGGAEMDDEVRVELDDELIRRFASSPEATRIQDVHWCRLVMDLSANYFGSTIATLDPTDLQEILFETIPRIVSVDASAASAVIEEMRAFYSFLQREFGLEQAAACLSVLSGDAIVRLEAAMSNPAQFATAKSLVMAGREAGFDMEFEEGIEAWTQALESQPLPGSAQAPPRPPRTASRAAQRAKKNQRKAERQARKKNR